MHRQLNPDFWHDRAEDARQRAAEMHDNDTRRLLIQIAMMYAAMALRVEERVAERSAAN